MKKNKPISTWPLSILVIVVSFLSILVVYQRVIAVWIEPNYQPNDTSAMNNFVFTPMTQDLDLGSHAINATGGTVNLNDDVDVSGNLNVDGSLTVNGAPVNGGPGTSYWDVSGNDISNNNIGNVLINNQLCFGTDCRNSWPAAANTYWLQTGNDIYYNAGRVGIGTSTPNRNLHLYDVVQNAELDIQSVSGPSNHWAMYHDSSSNDLRFWKGGGDRITFADTGEVSIGVAPNTNYQFYVNTNTASKRGIYSQSNNTSGTGVQGVGAIGVTGSSSASNGYGVSGISSSASGFGVFGTNSAVGGWSIKGQGTNSANGVSGEGSIGVSGQATGSTGIGILGVKTSAAAESVAGVFIGDLLVSGGYLRLIDADHNNNCDSSHVGRITLDSANNYLYVCSGGASPTWKRVLLVAP